MRAAQAIETLAPPAPVRATGESVEGAKMAILNWAAITNLISQAFQRKPQGPLDERLQQVWHLVLVLALLTLAGLIVINLGQTMVTRSSVGNLVTFSGFLIVLIVAAFIGGGGVGFIFGIPRLNAEPTPQVGDDPQKRRRALQSNTNLERISDWLTNGIVAVALVKLEELSGVMAAFGNFAATQFGSVVGASIVAQCVLVIGAIVGFIFGYIQTRTALALTFSDTEDALQKLEKVLAAVDERTVEDPDFRRLVVAMRESITGRAPAAAQKPESTPAR